MPSKKALDGNTETLLIRSIPETRERIQTTILQKYEETLEEEPEPELV